LRLFIDTGARLAKIANLTVNDVDPTNQLVWVMGKGKRPRALPIGNKTANAPNRYLRVRRQNRGRATDALWLGRGGGKNSGPAMTTSGIRQVIRNRAEEYLKSDNPALVPFILEYLLKWAHMKGDPFYRANNRLEGVARDPSVLPRPTDRERYATALDSHRDAGDTTTEGWRVWNHAEAWIKIRHKLVKSLTELVRKTEAGPCIRSDGEDSYGGDYGGRYKRTWKNLKAVDKAIEATV